MCGELRILVAEDNPILAKMLTGIRARSGFSVTFALSGIDALNWAQHESFDAIVTDEQMPEMTGRELCRSLRGDPRYADTPIVFVTGKQLEFDSQQLADDLDVTAVIGKPFDGHQLSEIIKNALVSRAPACSG
jgi:CheY-like chemotaxis protein